MAGAMGPDKDTVLDESVIWVSDDETDTDVSFGNSVLLVEPPANRSLEEWRSEETVDEECGLVVTFCKRGSVMPHSRYDCTTHPFEQTESEAALPVGRNTDACSQCYCYICDVPASECLFWTTPALCHCNAHHKSRHWKEQCSLVLAGTLVTFNLEPLEVNADLRCPGERLLQFVQELAGAYARYLRGERLQDSQACTCRLQPHSRRCPLHQQPQKEPVHRYSEVFELVSSCVSQAEREHPQASAVMLLGTVKEIVVHKDPSSAWRDAGSPGALKLAVPVLMARYKELLRYVKAVRCEDAVRLRALRDKVPFYLCKCGDFTSAANALLVPLSGLACCTACRLASSHFENYLKMFWMGSVPMGNDLLGTDQWAVGIGVPRKHCILSRQALWMLYKNPSLYRDMRCWGSLLAIWGNSPILEQSGLLTSLALQAPPPSFQTMVLRVANAILQELRAQVRPSLPASLFHRERGPEACLLLCAQAALHMLLTELPWLTSLLDIALAFGENFWALRLFLEGLLRRTTILPDVVGVIARDLSYQEHALLKACQTLGPDYVSELLCLFLSFKSPDIQTVGVLLSCVVVENLSRKLVTFSS